MKFFIQDLLNTEINEILERAIQLATKEGFIEIAAGIYLQTKESLDASRDEPAKELPDYEFFITTNDGAEPEGIDNGSYLRDFCKEMKWINS